MVITNSNGTHSLKFTSISKSITIILTPSPLYNNNITPQSNTFYSPYGDVTATIITDNNGQTAIKVNYENKTILFIQSGSSSVSTTSTQYYGSTGTPIQQSSYSLAYGGNAGSVTGPNGNTAYYAQGPNQGPNENAVAGTTNNSYSNYSNSLPPGIPASQIPPGQEDLYILKTEVVPPVCPACPQSSACPRQEPCPPCPACARCPEPAFECKKVPNYSAMSDEYLPTPVLNDFSQFGM